MNFFPSNFSPFYWVFTLRFPCAFLVFPLLFNCSDLRKKRIKRILRRKQQKTNQTNIAKNVTINAYSELNERSFFNP